MKAEQKRALIAAKLATLLREGTLEAGEDMVATDLMDRGLWDTIAPLIDSLVIRDAIEGRLEHYAGMPLSLEVVDQVMDAVDLALDSLSSGVERTPARGAAHNRSVGVWGGRIETGRERRDDA